ncbi:hypothetical protein VN97_g11005 [Penicillium thymicola]|uniref:Uncharacterized protein n=1 Tax=Penicillium thymicola TaxID=293382 RepID=A0AAI9T8S8_PENTH|nr:hypothetical protein VN97_g11005 [Penicillium thymicola]
MGAFVYISLSKPRVMYPEKIRADRQWDLRPPQHVYVLRATKYATRHITLSLVHIARGNNLDPLSLHKYHVESSYTVSVVLYIVFFINEYYINFLKPGSLYS